jgi:hypothetical protein
MHELKWAHQRHPRDLGAMVDAQVRRWVWKQKGRQALLERFGEWPLTARALKGELPNGAAQRPSRDLQTDRAH